MEPRPPRIPVHVVCGPPGSGKSALIARLLKEHGDWLGMVNGMPQDAPPNLRLLTTGCPCCTGRVTLQVGLARALRDTRAVRALVEVADPDHARRLEQSMEQLPLSLSMRSAARIQLPGDAEKVLSF